MNFKILMIAMDTLTKVMAAAADGEITGEEALSIIMGIAAAFGLSIEKGDIIAFGVESGSIYVKFDKRLLDKLKVRINLQ